MLLVLFSNKVVALKKWRIKFRHMSLLQGEVLPLRGFCAIDSDTLYVNHTTVIIASRKPTDAVRKEKIIVIKQQTC
jgi:hypothetical protein